MVWFHDIGVHVKLALIFISIFTEPAHSLFDITFRYTTFLERTYLFRMSDQHFEWFSILISRNWYSRQPRSFAFGITLSTQTRVAHKVWKIPPIRGGWIVFIFRRAVFWLLAFRQVQYFDFTKLACTSSSLFSFRHYVEHRTGLPIKSVNKIPLSGEVELFSFFEGPAFGCWHFDWFCLLIFSRNWRARQARSFAFGITLSTGQGCASSLEKFPLSGEVELFSFFEDLPFWLLAFRLVLSFDFTELACTSSSSPFYFRHYVEHGTGLRIKSEKIPPIWGGWINFIFSSSCFLAAGICGQVQYFDFTELACTSSSLFYFRHYVEHGTGLPIKSEQNPSIGAGWIDFIFLGAFFDLLAFGQVQNFDFTELACTSKLALLLSALRLAHLCNYGISVSLYRQVASWHQK